MQHARRTNPYPWTWEIPTAIIAAVLLIMVLAIHVARAIANLLTGGGWQLTPRAELFSSLPRLITGDAHAGLLETSGSVASSGQLWFWIVATEAAAMVMIAMVLRWGLARWGPDRIRGMASPAEADHLLSVARLRHSAAMIRPDLYGNGTGA